MNQLLKNALWLAIAGIALNRGEPASGSDLRVTGFFKLCP